MYIKIDVAVFEKFSEKEINFLVQPFDENGVIKKKWCLLQDKFNLESSMHFWRMELVHAIPNSWKKDIQQINSSKDILTVKGHHI